VYQYFKPFLFSLDPETAHHLSVDALEAALWVPGVSHGLRNYFGTPAPALQRTVFGINFPNPIGLAAGFDKDGKHYSTMSALGFGFVEIGTVTPRPQSGNGKPRLFRLPDDGALINRMGFNNDGVWAMVDRLRHRRDRPRVILGGNIGKNKDTQNADAHKDYLVCFDALFDFVDYFVVNVSSPNTPNLRDLQEKEPLTNLLTLLQIENKKRAAPKPILLKIAPDLTDTQLDDILDIAAATDLAGIVASNTTLDRSTLRSDQNHLVTIGNGGLSGAPLTKRSTEIIRYLHKKSLGKLPIIAVGGIMTPADALEKLDAGASLIQLYSGLVYYGPSLVRDINKAILQRAAPDEVLPKKRVFGKKS
jgi:dihydroorotate dehydrogenase